MVAPGHSSHVNRDAVSIAFVLEGETYGHGAATELPEVDVDTPIARLNASEDALHNVSKPPTPPLMHSRARQRARAKQCLAPLCVIPRTHPTRTPSGRVRYRENPSTFPPAVRVTLKQILCRVLETASHTGSHVS